MSKKFKNRYRISSSRHPWWDYQNDALYYVTLCTKNRECFFGGIFEGKIKLSLMGMMAKKFWEDIPQHFNHVILDDYVIMPNHIHGIVIINNMKNISNMRRDEALPRLYAGQYPQMSFISPKPQSLSVIIGSYKSIVTKRIKSRGFITFAWQSRFYDRIIRCEKEYNHIKKYIQNNPLNWHIDKENPEFDPY